MKKIRITTPKININTGAKKQDVLINAEQQLSDEIRAFRLQKEKLDAMNDHQTYLVIVFSCKNDKQEFADNLGICENTFVDGYELAKELKITPQKPSVKLPKPLSMR